jgi:hypothetical protein
MPRINGTGPMGMGPMTGRGFGPCGEKFGPLGWGRGMGRIMCGWFYRKYQGMNKEDRKELLKKEVADLKEELDVVEKELAGLGK